MAQTLKTITLVVFNRPDYTRQTLESLRANDVAGYRLFIAAEPGCQETIEVCRQVDFMPCEVFVNPKHLGVHWNNKTIYERVFDRGSEFNVAVEDDTPLSPDALHLANWFHTHAHRDDYLLLNFFNGSKDVARPLDIVESDTFCPWGYCCTRRKFEEHIAPNWMCDERGWDWSVCATMRTRNLKSLSPVLSRSRNIGKLGGTYCTPAYHDECFTGHTASNGKFGTDFRLQS